MADLGHENYNGERSLLASRKRPQCWTDLTPEEEAVAGKLRKYHKANWSVKAIRYMIYIIFCINFVKIHLSLFFRIHTLMMMMMMMMMMIIKYILRQQDYLFAVVVAAVAGTSSRACTLYADCWPPKCTLFSE